MAAAAAAKNPVTYAQPRPLAAVVLARSGNTAAEGREEGAAAAWEAMVVA
jgi:hypothetical protein